MVRVIVVMTAVNAVMIVGCVIRHMAVLVLMIMDMGVPVGMFVGLAVVGMGVFMFMGVRMNMCMFMSVQIDLHGLSPCIFFCLSNESFLASLII